MKLQEYAAKAAKLGEAEKVVKELTSEIKEYRERLRLIAEKVVDSKFDFVASTGNHLVLIQGSKSLNKTARIQVDFNPTKEVTISLIFSSKKVADKAEAEALMAKFVEEIKAL